MTIDGRKVALLVAGLLVGLAAGWMRSRVSGNEGYLANLIVTLFSVLAGFLSVVLNMVLMTRPPVFKSKQAQASYSNQMRGKLLRHSGIFYCYLLILFSVFIGELIRPYWPGSARLLEIIYSGLATCGLFWSFAVPGTLARLHEDQLTIAQETRKPGQ